MDPQISKHLSQDPILKTLVDAIELPALEPSTKFFYDLLESITSQQLSIKAPGTIINRFKGLLPGNFTPDDVYALTHDQLRSVGLSNNKAIYIHAVAHELVINKLNTDAIYQMSDTEVVTSLTKIKGVGRWTAEMMLIFSLARPDVFSVGDLGLRSAIEKLYNIPRTKLKAIEELSQQWKPYRSYAARYLWQSNSRI